MVSWAHGIRKFTLLMSWTLPFAVQLTRIRAVLVGGPVTVQSKVPVPLFVFVTGVAMVVQVVPPSRLTSMVTCSA